MPRCFRSLLCALVFLATAYAFFPDLSSYPSNTTELQLGAASISDIPNGAFARFTALQSLCVTMCTLVDGSVLLMLYCLLRNLSGNALTTLTASAFNGLSSASVTT
jgi:hypothetical protein